MKPLLALVGTCLVMLLSAGMADSYAQGVQTGILRGTVTDPQGQPVPGATITITSPALQGDRSTVSDTAGAYVFRALPPGDYTIKTSMPSFAAVERRASVPVGGAVEQNLTLTVAPVIEEVRVVGQVPTQLAQPSIGLNIRHAEVEALATSRTLFGIATLSPAVNEATPNATQLSINGSFAYDNNFMVNGVDVTDNLFGNPQSLFIEDAIEDTQVLTSGL